MILAFGKGGQVGTELGRLGAKLLGPEDVDLSQPDSVADVLRERRPNLVINAAAWTNVDGAETDEAAAQVVNADAPGVMARTCAELGVPFVHISTDYVFDGSGGAPWQPLDAVAPVNAYGRTKAAGEVAVRGAGGCSAIVRSSWVFSEHGSNFVTTMLRLGAERESLRVVADQVGGPTSARSLAGVLVAIGGRLVEEPGLAGTYHFSGRSDVSWADFARTIMVDAGLDCRIEDIPSADYLMPAARPLNSRLDCAATREAFGIDRPDWRLGLREILGALT